MIIGLKGKEEIPCEQWDGLKWCEPKTIHSELTRTPGHQGRIAWLGGKQSTCSRVQCGVSHTQLTTVYMYIHYIYTCMYKHNTTISKSGQSQLITTTSIQTISYAAFKGFNLMFHNTTQGTGQHGFLDPSEKQHPVCTSAALSLAYSIPL